MYNRIFFFSLLLLAGQLAFAQTLTGVVKSSLDENIPFANLRVLNSNLGAVADASGRYELSIGRGTYQLEVSALGYAAQVIGVTISGPSTSLDISLIPRAANLEEVVVTASKREETATAATTSLTSISAQQVEDSRTVGLANLTALVPNYLYQELGVGFQSLQAIRGIQVFSENPAVATYVDDVNSLDILANGFMFTDIERIEVLRGPQGTLFGRNAMGGVVNIITKKPTNRTEGFAEAGVGNFALQRFAAGIKMPLVKNKLFFGLNGLYQSREGYWKNDTTGIGAANGEINGQPVGGENNLYGNLYLRWLPSARFSATLNVKGQRDWSDNTGFFVSQPDENTAFKEPEKIYLRRIGSHERNIVNTSLALKYFGRRFTLSSVSALQQISLWFKDIDFPGYYHSFVDREIGEPLPPQQVWSQELRLTGSAPGNKLQYTVGLFGFTQDAAEPSTNTAYEVTPEEAAIFGLEPGTLVVSRNQGVNAGVAGYGELSYVIAPQLKLTAGIRYDREWREATFNGFFDALFVNDALIELRPDTTVSGNYSALSPKVALSYGLSDQSSIYASYTRGFRAGGINTQRYPADSGIEQTFDPEYSDNYELGYKNQSRNNRLRLSASVFLIQWQRLQLFNLAGPFTYARTNLGDAQSAGAELEITAIPLKGLQLDASLGLNQTEYKTFDLVRANFSTGEVVTTPIGGNRLSNAPTHTLFLSAQYLLKFNERLDLTIRGEVRNIGEFYTDIQNTLVQPAYTLLNANLTLSLNNRHSLSLWGQNLADETYLAFGNTDTSFGRSVRTAIGRTMGVTLKTHF
jgi:iron complex outermembrane receptor protein